MLENLEKLKKIDWLRESYSYLDPRYLALQVVHSLLGAENDPTDPCDSTKGISADVLVNEVDKNLNKATLLEGDHLKNFVYESTELLKKHWDISQEFKYNLGGELTFETDFLKEMNFFRRLLNRYKDYFVFFIENYKLQILPLSLFDNRSEVEFLDIIEQDKEDLFIEFFLNNPEKFFNYSHLFYKRIVDTTFLKSPNSALSTMATRGVRHVSDPVRSMLCNTKYFDTNNREEYLEHLGLKSGEVIKNILEQQPHTKIIVRTKLTYLGYSVYHIQICHSLDSEKYSEIQISNIPHSVKELDQKYYKQRSENLKSVAGFINLVLNNMGDQNMKKKNKILSYTQALFIMKTNESLIEAQFPGSLEGFPYNIKFYQDDYQENIPDQHFISFNNLKQLSAKLGCEVYWNESRGYQVKKSDGFSAEKIKIDAIFLEFCFRGGELFNIVSDCLSYAVKTNSDEYETLVKLEDYNNAKYYNSDRSLPENFLPWFEIYDRSGLMGYQDRLFQDLWKSNINSPIQAEYCIKKFLSSGFDQFHQSVKTTRENFLGNPSTFRTADEINTALNSLRSTIGDSVKYEREGRLIIKKEVSTI